MYHATYSDGFSQLVSAASFEEAVKLAREGEYSNSTLICVIYLKDVTIVPTGIWHTK